MEAHIADWTAYPSRLRIRVGTSPLSLSKEYMWAFHTTNHFGQGAKWTWCHVNASGDPTEAVYGEGQDLLNRLVTGHNILTMLADHYHIPFLPTEEN